MTPILILLASSFVVPAFTGYIESGPEARIDRNGVSRWTSEETVLLWGGRLSAGTLNIAFDAEIPAGEAGEWRLEAAGQSRVLPYADGKVRSASLSIEEEGWKTIRLRGVKRSGDTFGQLKGLTLSGEAAEGAQFNLKERRNSASVHIRYTAPEEPVEWFYNEVTATEDPIHTFYMACGFSRGYFGMQVNSPTERRIIFSVWDAGDVPDDRAKVDAENLVELVEKGPDVYASGFGNEGTGGHSHLKYMWKKGEKQRFLLRAQPEDNKTLYSAFYMAPEMTDWRLIARFRAPKDGGSIRRPHSFIENFWGTTGHLVRRAEYGPAWMRATDGKWHVSREATFTHDATGGGDRYDYDFGVSGARFWFQNGGFVGQSPKMGDKLTLSAMPAAPILKLPE